MSNKSYVGMALCFYCQEPKEVLLHRQLRDVLPHSAVYDMEPCDKCADLMEQGIILISTLDSDTGSDNPYRTGGWCVITEEAMRRWLPNKNLADDICKARFCFMPDEVWDKLGLPR